MKFTHTFTDLPAENEYPKLIRDKIPEIIKAAGDGPAQTRKLDDEECLLFLLRKIKEESEELVQADGDDHLVEEIADVYEVIDALLKLKAIDKDAVLAVQAQKRAKRGGFDGRLLMLRKV